MADSFTYLGQVTRGYMAYADTGTNQMLVAEPGGEYGIRAVEDGLPVPPADGWWETAAPAPAPAAKKTKAVSDAPAGGE